VKAEKANVDVQPVIKIMDELDRKHEVFVFGFMMVDGINTFEYAVQTETDAPS
jgi:hypothetical protein